MFIFISGFAVKNGNYIFVTSSLDSDGFVFDQQRLTTKEFTEKLIFNDKVQIGLILDSAVPRLIHSLSESKPMLLDRLERDHQRDGSDLVNVLQLAFEEFKANNNQIDNKNLIIMINSKPSKEFYNNLNRLKDEGVNVLFVVFGKNMNESDIAELKKKGNVIIEDGRSPDSSTLTTKDIVDGVEG